MPQGRDGAVRGPAPGAWDVIAALYILTLKMKD